MSTSAKPELVGLGPCVHGSLSEEERRGEQIIDFSVNSNPLGPSPLVAQALAQVDVSRYPDPEALALRRALSQRLGVPLEGIVVGNGSVELLWLLAAAYVRPGDTVLVVGPTFGEYARAAGIAGARVVTQEARAADGFLPNLEEACYYVVTYRPRLVFLCNPNNPTGVYLRRSEVERLLGACRESLLVVDEAYLPFVEDADSLLDLLPGDSLFLLRSMTKDYALTGLRLGYGLATPQVIQPVAAVRPPWNTNAAALAAGLASLQDEGHLERSRRVVAEARAYLWDAITRLDLRVLPSTANFLLVEVGDAARHRQELLALGCGVRDCTSFGLPEYIRVGVRTLPECQRLVATLREVRALV